MKSFFLLPVVMLVSTCAMAAAAGPSTPSAAGPANATHAAPAATTTDDGFAALDANHDGVLSREELRPHPKASHMAMVDENGDGVLSPAEFAELAGM